MAATKKKLHYRWVGKSEPKNCWHCGHRDEMDIYAIGGDFLRRDARCKPIGFQHSIKYAIREGYVCDRFAYFPKEAA